MEINTVLRVLAGARFRFGSEDELQEGLALALGAAGHSVEREVRLDSHNRIDLLVERIGIEVKVAGKPDAVLAQVTRYAQSELVDGLILVTTRMRHRLPPEINGKPVYLHSLATARL